MFGFVLRKRQQDVKKLLQGRINRTVANQLDEKARRARRCAMCDVAWIIPYAEDAKPDFQSAYPAVTRDISEQGLSFIHTEPVHDKRLLIGLKNDVETFYIVGPVEHCTSLGYGFYQIGVKPFETIDVDPYEAKRLEARYAARETAPAAAGV
jgi:hypothetical protein